MSEIERDELELARNIKELKTYQKNKIAKLIARFIEDNHKEKKSSFSSCPICGVQDAHIVKNGHTKSGKQVYVCRSCGKSFCFDIGKLTYNSHYDSSVWNKFVEDTLEGRPLRGSEESLGIDHSTAWRWRQKVMEAISHNNSNMVLGEKCELDEKYFRKNHKGKKIEGVKSKKRGTKDTKRGISNDKICLLCAADRSGKSVAASYNMGKPSQSDVDNIEHHFEKGTFFLSDCTNCYDSLYRKKASSFLKLRTWKEYDKYNHLNTVNSLHSLIEHRFMACRGIAMKYLNRYAALWSWVFSLSSKEVEEKVEKTLLLFSECRLDLIPRMRELCTRGILHIAEDALYA